MPGEPNLRRQAQELDPGVPWAQGLREDYNTLEKEKAAALALVADLDAADAAEPGRPHLSTHGWQDRSATPAPATPPRWPGSSSTPPGRGSRCPSRAPAATAPGWPEPPPLPGSW